jgi:ribosomal protein S12 methylthiotransferase
MRRPRDSSDTPEPVRVGLISLGCAKNLVDSEVMLGCLLERGFQVVNDPAQAQVLVVNTCSFIDAAKAESINAIFDTAAVREAQCRGQALVVAGCLTQRFPDELPRLLPEVDAFVGIDQVTRIPDLVEQALERRSRKDAAMDSAPVHRSRSAVETPPVTAINRRPRFIPDYATPRFRLTPPHFAYLKIAEGCNHPCSFCIIPRMRGSHRSRPLPDLVEDARRLLADGVRELNLISQDSTYYGLDLRPRRNGYVADPARFKAATRALPADTPTLCSLLRALNGLQGDFWIRLLYTHPAHWTDELIRTIAECPKIARYIDMPLQHIHDLMLERMRRETNRAYIEELIARIREGIPGIALRTTFIVGFPGETSACFESLLDFIRTTRFERLGVFAYSREEDTRAAKMTGQIPDRIKQERRARAMEAQRAVARSVAAAQLGRTLRVLVEKPIQTRALPHDAVQSWEHGLIRADEGKGLRLRGRYFMARGEADAPDIDGRVYVRGTLPVGQFAHVRVVDHTDYDLLAEPVEVG